jgi:hypothetical protein
MTRLTGTRTFISDFSQFGFYCQFGSVTDMKKTAQNRRVKGM